MLFEVRVVLALVFTVHATEASFRDDHPFWVEPAKDKTNSWEGSLSGASGHLRGSSTDRTETWSQAEARAAGHGSCGMDGLMELLAVKHCYAKGGCCRNGQCHMFGCGKVQHVNYAARTAGILP